MVLGVPQTAGKSEIKKAYHKSALSSHPDKVPESERAEAEIRFKAVSQAYEILYDDQKRDLYDQHGMAAFEKGSGGGGPGGMGAEVDLDDILQQMFGMGMGGGGMPGMPGMGGGGGAARRKRAKGPSEEQEYEVTLEELYKGKTTHFTSTKNVLCSTCSGTGGREKAKPKTCETCKGKGTRLQSVGPGLVTTVPCSTCSGEGQFFRDKDRCKRCKGARVVQSKKKLELYIPPGSREGEQIVLAGEADQSPDWQEPGDIVFVLSETEHSVFSRAGPDLRAEVEISLAEALTGFSRVVVKQLDGRGIKVTVPQGKIMRPGQLLRVRGEGMPVKRSDAKGDLYLHIEVVFPEDGWMAGESLVALLPNAGIEPIQGQEVDEVEYEDKDVDFEDFGAGSDDPRAGAEWEDEDAGAADPGCQQQ